MANPDSHDIVSGIRRFSETAKSVGEAAGSRWRISAIPRGECRDCCPPVRDSALVYIREAAPERVIRARSHIDHAFHAFYLDQRTASLASGFESLLKIERKYATAQFKLWVPAMASMVGSTITPQEAEVLLIRAWPNAELHGRER